MDPMEGTGNINRTVKKSTEAPQPNNKETDQILQQDGCNSLESHALFLSPENDLLEGLPFQRSNVCYNQSGFFSGSPENFTETLDGKVQVRCASSKDVAILRPLTGSEPPALSPCSMNSAGGTFEELTLKNYKDSNLLLVGSSGNLEEARQLISTPTRKGQWQHLYQLAGGSGIGSSPFNAVSKEPFASGTKFSSHEPKYGSGEERKNMFPPKVSMQKPLLTQHSKQYQGENAGNVIASDNCSILNSPSTRIAGAGGIRTKVLSASGFAQFFVKNTLKGKGVVFRDLEPRDGSGIVIRDQNPRKDVSDAGINSDEKHSSCAKADDLSQHSGVLDGTNLREWLKSAHRRLNKPESLHIFKQILELVDVAHSQGAMLHDIRPSCFIILPSNHVKYVGSSGLLLTKLSESVDHQEDHYPELHSSRKRHALSLVMGHGVDLKHESYLEQDMHRHNIASMKHQKLGEHNKFAVQHQRIPATPTDTEMDIDSLKEQNFGSDFREQQDPDDGHMVWKGLYSPIASNAAHQKVIYEGTALEERWYTSPEELNGRILTFSSNIYSLGVLLFELFCCFESWEVHAAAMSDLRQRILPPNFLSENPKEAGFCLWLLHPEPSSRPKAREVLQSEIICGAQSLSMGGQSTLSVDEEDAESELLLHFLVAVQEQKMKQASKLSEDIASVNADIEEVEKRRSLLCTDELLSQTHEKYNMGGTFKSPDDQINGNLVSDKCPNEEPSMGKEDRLMRNINQLENAYFAMRSKINISEIDAEIRSDRDVLRNQGKCSLVQGESEAWCTRKQPVDRLGAFFDGLCKYARYSKFEVRGVLRNGDLLNSANVICSLSFDRDEDYFAAAGVSRKIKIFEFGSLLNDTVDVHYPVIEMTNKSKLSCVCWNSYIKNYLASTDYDGVVQLWDASTGQGFLQYIEHQKRAWSVDFSQVDPTKLASGSDDCTVKLWSINEGNCTGTIRNMANVCCVQFSPHSSHLLAFGSADYKIYCYDLRNMRMPWCTLVGHEKAVSYVKFLDPETLVSASTDNTLKLWDLNKTNSNGLSTNACSLTFNGHTNEKNFVGLSVSDGYIACGSETNEVYAYYRSQAMPITSHKFGSIDPISGQETGDDNGQFVSSVCWRGKSGMIVSANSNGCIKLLQLV